MRRRLRSPELVEQRERKSLETALVKERRVEERERTERQLPPAEPSRDPHTDVFNKAAKEPINLMAEFERAARSDEDQGGDTGGSAQDPTPESEIKIERRRRTSGRRRQNAMLETSSPTVTTTAAIHLRTIHRDADGIGISIGIDNGLQRPALERWPLPG
jgi:hypothetical protein